MPELDLHFEKALYEVKASRKHFSFNIFCYLIETFVDRIPLVHGYYYGNIETEKHLQIELHLYMHIIMEIFKQRKDVYGYE